MAVESYKTYGGNDLGAVYSPERTKFRVWAPEAQQMTLQMYAAGNDTPVKESCDMEPGEGGTWSYVREGDCAGLYYTYLVTGADGARREAVDPYARATGVNGKRAMVVDLAGTNPKGFGEEEYRNPESITDAVIYEGSVRDFTADASSGAVNRGKFLGLTETGTKNSYGEATGLDYISGLGVTHVQFLPVFDYETVDEAHSSDRHYNWGYDPDNYNVPEGSYATDPFDGAVRVREMKEMIQAFHDRGIGVIMDVVYNHTFRASDSNLNKLAPGYYYRSNERWMFTNGSGCGNEIASERTMVRKLIIDSLVYWMTEYHIDGFRFDLMAVLDTETMQEAARALRAIRPDVFLYGEPWNGGESALPVEQRAFKCNMERLQGIGAFNDGMRDAVKGDVFQMQAQGFVSGGRDCEHVLKSGIMGTARHLRAHDITYGGEVWMREPEQSINYVSCHDNYTLWDKLTLSCPQEGIEMRKRMNRLAAAIILTSQGVPFLLSGEEFLRSKPIPGTGILAENSYNMADAVNSLKWDQVHEHADMVAYYQGLMAFRRKHPVLRLRKAQQVEDCLRFLDGTPSGVVAYTLDGTKVQDDAAMICVIFNNNREPVTVELPEPGVWSVVIDAVQAGVDKKFFVESNAVAEPVSAMVLVKE